jgi:hypothetical protein
LRVVRHTKTVRSKHVLDGVDARFVRERHPNGTTVPDARGRRIRCALSRGHLEDRRPGLRASGARARQAHLHDVAPKQPIRRQRNGVADVLVRGVVALGRTHGRLDVCGAGFFVGPPGGRRPRARGAGQEAGGVTLEVQSPQERRYDREPYRESADRFGTARAGR